MSEFTPSTDPRFGDKGGGGSNTVTTVATASGPLTRTEAVSSPSVTLVNPTDPLSLTAYSQTASVNTKTWTTAYSRAQNQVTLTSPLNRQSVTTLDPKGLPSTVQVPGILPVTTDYWDDGKVKTITQGARVTQFTYDANGNLETLIGPEGVSLAFKNDLLGRVLTATSTPRAGSGLAPTATHFRYDESGNPVSVQPPGQPEHLFSFSPQDLEVNYSPPQLASVPNTSTTSTWDDDKTLTLEARLLRARRRTR